jgi:amino acid efflux transporter
MSTGLGSARGAALYVGALMGPGVLLIPALAVDAAGPASLVAWVALLLLSVPLAATFATLGVRHPEPGGVAVYVRTGLGEAAATTTATWFLTAVLMGAPAVALVGGFYVADLTGAGEGTALLVAAGIVTCALGANAGGVQVAAGAQLVLSGLLVLALAIGVAVAIPQQDDAAWTPFAPEGVSGVATAVSLLVWQFVGWEAMAQLAGDFRDAKRDLPRAVAIAFGVVTLLYLGLAVASVGVGGDSSVPLADLMGIGFGEAGRAVTAGLAVVLTLGTMNVYVGAAARLAGALAREGALPRWLDDDARRAPADDGAGLASTERAAAGTAASTPTVPRRPLLLLAAFAVPALAALHADLVTADTLVRATSACFVGVYLLALSAAARILTGRGRGAAIAALALMAGVAACSGAFVLVPLATAAVVLAIRRSRRPRAPRGAPRRPPRRPSRRTRPGHPGSGS